MVTSESAPSKTIILMSSDGETFAVEESVALVCQTLKNMIDDNCAGGTIPLPNVSSKILSKVLEYCKRHAGSAAATEPNNLLGGGAAAPEPNNLPGGETVDEELKKFDADFVNVDEGTLLSLVLAANYLDIKQLLDLTCQSVADMIKDKSVEEVRKMFNVENDFTAAEEAAIRKEHWWAFE